MTALGRLVDFATGWWPKSEAERCADRMHPDLAVGDDAFELYDAGCDLGDPELPPAAPDAAGACSEAVSLPPTRPASERYLPLYAERRCGVCGFYRGQHIGVSEVDSQMRCPSVFVPRIPSSRADMAALPSLT